MFGEKQRQDFSTITSKVELRFETNKIQWGTEYRTSPCSITKLSILTLDQSRHILHEINGPNRPFKIDHGYPQNNKTG
jgi:hypothetical protein